MNITIIGSGYVGLVASVCLAEAGNYVMCLDINNSRIKKLNKGQIPIYEPGLDKIANKNIKNKRLSFTSDIKKSVEHGDIQFICVGTPQNEDGSADIEYVLSAASNIAKNMTNKKVIVNKSTVPVGSAAKVSKLVESILDKRNLDLDFSVVSNPEFLREGEAIRDFIFPDRIVVGSNDDKSNRILKNLYNPLVSKGANYFHTSRRAAEMIKYASNAFLATKITFINELANLSEKIGIDIKDISVGMGSDQRIGDRFLRAGPAYGGSCFPKDTRAILNTANNFKTDLSIIKSVVKSNDLRKILLTQRVKKILNGKLKDKKITFLGVTFKPNTDDMRDSLSLNMIPYLSKRGAKIFYYDPTGEKKEFKKIKNCIFKNNIKDLCINSDLIILHTDWDEFKSLDFRKLVKSKKFKLYDLRNLYNFNDMLNKKIEYYSIGRPSIT